jgi:cyclic pyranopterin phosphate synthase
MPAGGVPSLDHGEILTYEELLLVAAAAVDLGVRKIRVTGGEPLVRKGVVDFVRNLADLPGSPEVVLTTNGLSLSDLASDLAAAGLARVNVSLDTLRSDRFAKISRREGLDRVLAGLEAAEVAGLTPVKINMVPMEGINDDEIVDFARLTLQRSVDVRFIEFMPFDESLEKFPGSRLPMASIMEELSRLGILLPVTSEGPVGPARLFQYPGAPGRIGVIPVMSGHICGKCNRLRVTPDGRIKPCLLGDEEIDLRRVLRSGGGREDIKVVLQQAADAKPERHRLDEDCRCLNVRPMPRIGG